MKLMKQSEEILDLRSTIIALRASSREHDPSRKCLPTSVIVKGRPGIARRVKNSMNAEYN